MVESFKCDKTDCHGNRYGRCWILRERIHKRKCPFYKSTLKLKKELDALIDGDWALYHEIQRRMK